MHVGELKLKWQIEKVEEHFVMFYKYLAKVIEGEWWNSKKQIDDYCLEEIHKNYLIGAVQKWRNVYYLGF